MQTKEQEEFAENWFHKILVPNNNYDTNFATIPKQKYLVTAAELDYSDGLTILALMGESYNIKTDPCWFTFEVPNDGVKRFLDGFDDMGYPTNDVPCLPIFGDNL